MWKIQKNLEYKQEDLKELPKSPSTIINLNLIILNLTNVTEQLLALQSIPKIYRHYNRDL